MEEPRAIHNLVFNKKSESRSGLSTATWDGPHVTIDSPDFDFSQLLKASVERDNAGTYTDDDLDRTFGLSPLSTPPGSPGDITPRNSPILPAADALRTDNLLDADSFLDIPSLSVPATGSSEVSADVVSQRQRSPTGDAGSSLTGKFKRKQRAREKQRAQRKVQRVNDRENVYGGNYKARPNTYKKYVVNAKPIKTKFNMRTAKVASTAYVGLNAHERSKKGSKKVYQLDDLVGEGSLGFEYVEWDGITATPILAGDKLMALLAGKPGDSDGTWPGMERQAAELLARAQKKCRIPKGEKVHRRGTFKVLRSGVSHGTGQNKPSNARSNKTNTALLAELNKADPFKRLAGFASSVMATWAPDLYEYCTSRLGALFMHDATLNRNFSTSVFTANTYNLGPRTVCFKHTDCANLPFGWCSVTALGSFDPKKGGHLILWDCRLVIEFPPGSTILIPSAVLAHSNVDVRPDETRFSFTQYTAGGLIRWVENGFQPATQRDASMTPEEKAEKIAEDKNRWKFGLSLFPEIETNVA